MSARKDSAVCTLFISLKSGGFINITLEKSAFRDFVTKRVSKGTSPPDYLIPGTSTTGQVVPVQSRGVGELTEWTEYAVEWQPRRLSAYCTPCFSLSPPLLSVSINTSLKILFIFVYAPFSRVYLISCIPPLLCFNNPQW